jgi:hypothetical protein
VRVSESCDAIAKLACITASDLSSGTYFLDADGVISQAYCVFDAGEGWTLVLKVPDSDSGWHFGSSLWTGSMVLNPENMLHYASQPSGKSPSYSSLSGTSIRLAELDNRCDAAHE